MVPVVRLVADVCLIGRKSCQRRPDSILGRIRYWVLNCSLYFIVSVLINMPFCILWKKCFISVYNISIIRVLFTVASKDRLSH